MTATATAPTLDTALHTKAMAIFGPDGFLNENNVERREEIELLALATFSGVDTLFLGDPGVGKSYMIELLVNYGLTDMSLFTHLFAKDQSADEVLGPRDIMAMKAGEIRRLTSGYIPDANYAFADEIFKASPPMLNPLLDLLANRVLKMGGVAKDCSQLIAIFMASNELPDREDLNAFRDRIGVTKFVQPVRTPEGRRMVTDLQLDQQTRGIDTSGVDPLTLDEIRSIRDQIRQIVVPDAIREMMVKAQQDWAENGHPPSQRRIGQMWRLVKAHAYMNGRSTVVADDLLPCQHAAWNHPDHAASAREVILEFASVFTRKATRLKESMEPVVGEIETLRHQLDALDANATVDDRDQILQAAYKLMRQLKRMGTEAEREIATGKEQGQDTSQLEGIVAEVSRAYDWAQGAMIGADPK